MAIDESWLVSFSYSLILFLCTLLLFINFIIRLIVLVFWYLQGGKEDIKCLTLLEFGDKRVNVGLVDLIACLSAPLSGQLLHALLERERAAHAIVQMTRYLDREFVFTFERLMSQIFSKLLKFCIFQLQVFDGDYAVE